MPKKWLEEKCVFCSLCVALCPYEAFRSSVSEGTIEYVPSRCVDCESCPPSFGCPRRAIDK